MYRRRSVFALVFDVDPHGNFLPDDMMSAKTIPYSEVIGKSVYICQSFSETYVKVHEVLVDKNVLATLHDRSLP
jgi:hypothetical protein